jgi:hypothetical protein
MNVSQAGFWEGHGFSRAAQNRKNPGFSPWGPRHRAPEIIYEADLGSGP